MSYGRELKEMSCFEANMGARAVELMTKYKVSVLIYEFNGALDYGQDLLADTLHALYDACIREKMSIRVIITGSLTYSGTLNPSVWMFINWVHDDALNEKELRVLVNSAERLGVTLRWGNFSIGDQHGRCVSLWQLMLAPLEGPLEGSAGGLLVG
jgi:hypothetical protein